MQSSHLNDIFNDFNQYPVSVKKLLPIQITASCCNLSLDSLNLNNNKSNLIKLSYIGFYLFPLCEKELKAKIKNLVKDLKLAIEQNENVHQDFIDFISYGQSKKLNVFTKSLGFSDYNDYIHYLSVLNDEAKTFGFSSCELLYRPSKYLDFCVVKYPNIELTLEEKEVLSECLPYQIDYFFISKSNEKILVSVYKNHLVIFTKENNEIIVYPPTVIKLNRKIENAVAESNYYMSSDGQKIYSNGSPSKLTEDDFQNMKTIAHEKWNDLPVNFKKCIVA
ncbi:hypothetical protein [Photobacterium carnosum]|uniref:hypothetical protein n=1 Tax=Photobacterium carnosum TaxID=2023717 RepID=UPI001E3DA053|nr:hypothetical protein [Photobacterium carnosum]MCD9528345.1 hypothetical protein [Photobacterium carnosum]